MKYFNKQKRRWGLLVDKVFISSLFFKKSVISNVSSQSILIFDFHRIGDIVLLTALLKSIRKKYKNYQITLVAGKQSRAILANNPGIINELIIFDAPWVTGHYSIQKFIKTIQLIKSLRKVQFGFGIEVRGDLRQIILMHICGVKNIIGFSFTGGSHLLNHSVPYDTCKHLIDYHKQIATFLKCPKENFYPEIWLSKVEKNHLSSMISNKNQIIGIHPGASNQLKMLPYETIVNVIRELTKRKYTICLFQGPQEKEYISKIVHHTNSKVRIIQTELRDMILNIASCSLVLSMDSACGHIASALKVPSVIVFGPTEYQFCKPIGKKVSIVQIDDVPCRPCNQKKCIHQYYHYCMKGISSEMIIYRINGLLNILC